MRAIDQLDVNKAGLALVFQALELLTAMRAGHDFGMGIILALQKHYFLPCVTLCQS